MRETFIEESGAVYNPDHRHLLQANIGALWTNVPYARQLRPVVGQAEIPRPPQMGGAWAKARWAQQLREWFGARPDFIITIYAPYAEQADRGSFMATCEHELYHCTIIRYTQQGQPIWGIQGHDVEEHVGVVRRYGPGAAAGATRELVEAARRRPTVTRAQMAAACGTCLKLAA